MNTPRLSRGLSCLFAAAIVAAPALVTLPARAQDAQAAPAREYVCPPCDMECDAKVFDKPGRCPACGAELVEKAAAARVESNRPLAAILIFEGVQIIDYTGPYEVLGQGGYRVFTVAEEKRPLRTAMGMTVIPEHTFADAPPADILVVPGGNVVGPTGSAATLRWVKRRHDESRQTMSVCNGAFILAKAGLLDGLSATTFYGLIDELRTEAPKTKVVSDRRYVDNGRIITTAGLSSGIDGALHIIEKLRGRGTAQASALHMEYDWHPDSGWARAALADRLIPGVNLGDGSTMTPLSTQGDRNRWDISVAVQSPLAPADILAKVDEALTGGQWVKGKTEKTAKGTSSSWSRKGPEIGSWTGRLTLEPDGQESGRYVMAMAIKRSA